MRRSRGRNPQNRGSKHGHSRNYTFDSNGPDVRIRGTAFQVFEKYQQLARDAYSSGDRIAMENFYQHAEHYFRIMNAENEDGDGPQQRQNGQNQPQHNGRDQSGGQPHGRRLENQQHDGDATRTDDYVDPTSQPQPSLPDGAFPAKSGRRQSGERTKSEQTESEQTATETAEAAQDADREDGGLRRRGRPLKSKVADPGQTSLEPGSAQPTAEPVADGGEAKPARRPRGRPRRQTGDESAPVES